MTTARRALCNLYYLIAFVALIGTWRQNIAFGNEMKLGPLDMFVQFWPALFANRATISITVDIFMIALAAVVWMVLEARRLQIRGVWLYVIFAILIAISVTFPLFLAARERRLAELEGAATDPKPALADKLGLGFFTLSTLAFAIWCTLR